MKSYESKKSDNSNGKDELDTYFVGEIELPTSKDVSFTGINSWKKLWAFTGPGLLMSIAYLDPGNIESDMQCGVVADYKLLWILLYSTTLGLLMQILSARIGVVTGQHLAELCYKRYRTAPRLLLWIMTEIAIIGSDIQEVIGTALALYMLTNRLLPLWGGVLLTILDTFSFLFLDKFGVRKLEAFFGFLIAIMAVTFGYEFFFVKPDIEKIAIGLALPYCRNCGKNALLQAVGIVGAIIQPHNLYLHSALVKSRKVDNKISAETKDANRYVLIESAVVLFISFIINLFVISVFAKGLFGKTNLDVYKLCSAKSSHPFVDMNVLSNDTNPFDADLYQAGIYLGCQFGAIPFYVWAVGILAAGQSSTMTGTYAGQFSMEGFLNLKWPRWKRVLLTRSIAILPTLAVTVFSDVKSLTGMNDYLNALMVIQLPFAVLPALTFSSSKIVMGKKFANNLFNLIVATSLSVVVIVVNIYFFIQVIIDHVAGNGAIVYPLSLIFGGLYVIFILYLNGCFLSTLGFRFHEKPEWLGKWYQEPDEPEYKYLD